MPETFQGEVSVTDSQGQTLIEFNDNGRGDIKVLKEGKQVAHLHGGGGLVLGFNGRDGHISLFDSEGKHTVQFTSKHGLQLFNESRDQVAHLHRGGGLVLGGNGRDGHISLYDSEGKHTVQVSGQDGDVILKNADAAEDFDIVDAAEVGAGSVVVIDTEYRLKKSRQAYDRCVAGVVSGAGQYKPALILDRDWQDPNRLPVALAGKVFVNADANNSPIKVGDLLTTSDLPGFAMSAIDPKRAFGAVIGKALTPLNSGTGQIVMLVSLQ